MGGEQFGIPALGHSWTTGFSPRGRPTGGPWWDQMKALGWIRAMQTWKHLKQDTPHLWLTRHLGGNCFLLLFQNRNIKCSTSHNSARSFSLNKYPLENTICSCCCCSAGKLCLTLCDAMDCSTPDSSVLDYLPEFTQIHVYWVGDTI